MKTLETYISQTGTYNFKRILVFNDTLYLFGNFQVKDNAIKDQDPFILEGGESCHRFSDLHFGVLTITHYNIQV